MFRKRKLTKIIAIFFLLEMVADIVLPHVAMALTSGPTAPEATSFEPVDTTDMVNPLSGDFVYNLPLLEVPGPHGGYPISLSYHAGILAKEEASWVGLGWTLNPGSINRHVNGFADDHDGAIQNSRFYWEGGETHQVDIGINYGFGGVGYSQGVSIGVDTYQGFGVGGFAKLGVNLVDNGSVKLGAGINFSVDPWGNPSAGVSATASSGSSSASVGIVTDFKSVSAYASTSLSVLDASISSENAKANLNVGVGGINVNSGQTGKINTSDKSFVLPIPFLYLGYKYKRYWIDELDWVESHGALYNPTSPVGLTTFNDNAYDSYSLPTLSTMAYRNDPDTYLHGTFLAYDNYNVQAQGISGSISPHGFRKHIYRKNKWHIDDEDEIYDVIHVPTQVDYGNHPMQFRFIGDFSNKYEYEHEEFDYNTTDENSLPLSYSFRNEPLTGENGDDGIVDNNLAGSKNVSYFKNSQIKNNPHAFIEATATGFDRSSTIDEQIGGYQITNESGVTYHYSLPVYSSNEFYYSERRDVEDQLTFNYHSKPTQYAYTWMLTAITGPDYVDRGSTGLDASDWGYWVEFEYGKWTDQYVWRSPGIDMELDIDTNWKNFSEGIKELYYLDAVRTKTHTAWFVKDIRDDAKSSLRVFRDRQYSTRNATEFSEAIGQNNKSGGFIPKVLSNMWYYGQSGASNGYKTKTINYTPKPVSSLKLSKIILMENGYEEFQKDNGSRFSQSFSIESTIIGYNSQGYVNEGPIIENKEIVQQTPNNVLDISDLEEIDENNALKVIVFNSDNDYLSPETVNSFSHSSLENDNTPSVDPSAYDLNGRLSLKSVLFKGRSGESIIPSIKFEYENQYLISGKGTVHEINDKLSNINRYELRTQNDELEIGDIITFNNSSSKCFATVYSLNSDGNYLIQYLGKNKLSSGDIDFQTTKNPPFNVENYDEWGMYKGDYFKMGNDHIDRIRTTVSKNHVDVWSLRRVTSPLGNSIDINYESDEYGQAVLSRNYPLVISNISFNPDDHLTTVTLGEDFDNAEYFYEIGDKAYFLFMLTEGEEMCNDMGYTLYPKVRSGLSGVVEQVGGNSITVRSKCLSQYFNIRHYFNDENDGYECYEPEKNNSTYNENIEITDSTFTEHRPPPPGGGEGCERYKIRYYKSGNLIVYKSNNTIAGGGLRVEKLSINDKFSNKSHLTTYNYNDAIDPELSSGVTSYAPKVLDKYLLNDDYDDNSTVAGTFRSVLYNKFSELMALQSEVPAPGVMYKYVTVKEGVARNNLKDVEFNPTYSIYEFEVFNTDMLVHEASELDIPDGLIERVDMDLDFSMEHDRSKLKEIKLKDFTAKIGQLKSITSFSVEGKKISSMTQSYLHDDLSNGEYELRLENNLNNQGKLQETFIDARALFKEFAIYKLYGGIFSKIKYPSVKTGQTNINYLTGITTTTKNLAFDFYSGSVTKTLSTDGYGNTYITESIPAYHKYPGMGLAMYGGANMLVQNAATKSYQVDNELNQTPVGLLSAAVQTWSNEHLQLDNEQNLIDNNEIPATLYRETFTINYPNFFLDVPQSTFNVGDKVVFKDVNRNLYFSIRNWDTEEQAFKLNELGGTLMPGTSVTGTVQRNDVYRKHRSYTYLGNDVDLTTQTDGLYPYSNFEANTFDAWAHGQEPSSDQWQKNSEITLYDVYSHALEAKDVNGNFAATKMDSKQEQVFATVANAEYHEFAFSGAEDELSGGRFGGDVLKPGGTITSENAHTGEHSIITTDTDNPFKFVVQSPREGRKYRASIWSTQPDAILKYTIGAGNEQTLTSTSDNQAGGWYLHNIDIPYSGSGNLTIAYKGASSTTIYWDDFRVHPIDANMTSYVYNQWGELSYILDANNIYTHYEYDAMGRLKSTYRESFKYGKVKTREHTINYARNEE